MGIQDYSIRKFRTEDARTVTDMINEAFSNGQNELLTQKSVLTMSNQKKMYVAVEEGTVVGTASIDHDTISAVFADNRYRKNEIIEALLKLLEEIAANNGMMSVKLEGAANEQKLYERLGYKAVGEAFDTKLGTSIKLEKYLV